MTALLIPLEAEGPYFGQGVELEGRAYRLDFRWNTRTEQWVIDVFDGGGASLVTGVRGVINVPLLQKYGLREDLPPGELFLLDSTGQDLEATLNDLGSRVELVYLPAADL